MGDTKFEACLSFLRANGCEKPKHTGRLYIDHLAGLYQVLKNDGHDEDLCYAGMFHSIYGTEHFPPFMLTPSRRPEVAALIGERAEFISYVNCAMDNVSFDKAVTSFNENPSLNSPTLLDRFDQMKPIPLTEQQWLDLRIVHWYDWLEKAMAGYMFGHRHRGHAHVARSLGYQDRHAEALTHVRLGGGKKQNMEKLIASTLEALR